MHKMNSTFHNTSQCDTSEDLTSPPGSLKSYAKEFLKSRIFLGRYIERRLVTESIGYRDIIVISPAETELKRDLTEIQQKIRSAYPKIQWIGITETDSLGYHPASLCIWSEIVNKPFGVFWFQIKTVQFKDEEVIIKVKCLRHITDAFLEAEPILTGGGGKKGKLTAVDNNIDALVTSYVDIKENLKGALSITNVREFVTFIFAFVIAVFTGSTAFIGFLGNFVLALIKEMSHLVKNSTPLMLGVLDFFSKIVGGFYILLAMIFKPSPQPHNYNNYNQRRISYDRDDCFD